MRIIHAFIVALLLAVAVPSVATADTFNFSTAGVKFDAPSGWTSSKEEGVLVIAPKDGSLALVFVGLRASDLDAAGKELDAALAEDFTHIKEKGSAEELSINGMPALAAEATAKSKEDGSAVELGMVLVQTKSGRFMLILGVADAKNPDKHDAAVLKLIQSIRPM
ncbi:MAG: hypothetical protein AAFX99_14085 [Myxococcota bacterium]